MIQGWSLKRRRKRRVYFHRLGSSTSSRRWEAGKNGAAQVRQNVCPPCASISLSRLLFMECDAAFKVLEDSLARAAKPAPATTTLVTLAPAPTVLPSVTPGAQTEEPANTVSTSSTLNFDSFVGSRDKGDKKKLEGVLFETVSILAPGRGHRTIPVASTNGKQSFITVVPHCKCVDGLIETNHHSGWMDTIFRHCIAPGESVSRAYAFGTQMAKNHEEDFKAVAKDVARVTDYQYNKNN
jgi:hypothetical protein